MRRVTRSAVLAFWLTTLASHQLVARDDGRFANSPLKPWFDRLASGKGLCCSFADGVTVEDVDWDTQDGHYRVQIYGQWIGWARLQPRRQARRSIVHRFAHDSARPAYPSRRLPQ